MALAGCHGHEHWNAIKNSAAEHDMSYAASDLARPREAARHKVVILQQGLLRVRQAYEVAYFGDVPLCGDTSPASIHVLAVLQ